MDLTGFYRTTGKHTVIKNGLRPIRNIGKEQKMKKKENKKFNVLTWDFNGDKLECYDVLPYFRGCYAERKKKAKGKRIQKIMAENPDMKKYYGVPATFGEFKEFIKDESMYMYWSRCEWEIIVHGWPVRKNDYKIDVHEQVMMNIDTIADILWKEIENGKEKKKKVG